MARQLRLDHGLETLLRSVLGRGGALRIRAVGGSMWPALAPGDLITIGPLKPGEPQIGQVVVWARSGRVVAHRVVALAGESVITRGDATLHDDPPVARTEVLGVVRGRRRPWGSYLRHLLTGRG